MLVFICVCVEKDSIMILIKCFFIIIITISINIFFQMHLVNSELHITNGISCACLVMTGRPRYNPGAELIQLDIKFASWQL
jgi:hypothetical protein